MLLGFVDLCMGLGISAICYFAMLSGEGFKVLGSCREFYW